MEFATSCSSRVIPVSLRLEHPQANGRQARAACVAFLGGSLPVTQDVLVPLAQGQPYPHSSAWQIVPTNSASVAHGGHHLERNLQRY